MPAKIQIPLLLTIILMQSFCFPVASPALQADDLLVVANRNTRDSMALAEYYMEKRSIPLKNLVKIFAPEAEACTREEYDRKIDGPIRKKLEKYTAIDRPRCLVLMYGVPLKIQAVPLTKAEQAEISSLKDEQGKLNDQLKKVPDKAGKKSLQDARNAVARKIKKFRRAHNTGASVDSELMLLLSKGYPLPMWVLNPFFIGFKRHKTGLSKGDVIMVSRLDGPSPDIVRRVIDDAIAVEKKGLAGKAYFDARWQRPKDKRKLAGYALYDASIHHAADRVRKSGRLPIVVDEKQALFKAGDCPEAALYCGWYSLARYVDAFEWQTGAVGYHIASSECATLKRPKSQVWCKRMLEEGIAATIGPVAEPYVQAFPMPELFFGFLTDGYLTLAECYLVSLPYLSWKMVLIGDPLYRPFKEQMKNRQD